MTTLNSRLQLALLNHKKGRNPLEKGFTLVELLIVVVILGILSAVALPAFLNQQNRAAASALNAEAMAIAKSCAALQVTAEHELHDNGNTTGTCNAAGTESTFTASDANNRASNAVATVRADGSVALTTTSEPN